MYVQGARLLNLGMYVQGARLLNLGMYVQGARLLNLGMYCSGCTYNFIIEVVLVGQLALTGVLEFLYLPLIHDSGIVWFFVSLIYRSFVTAFVVSEAHLCKEI
jgi:hypothetical protein